MTVKELIIELLDMPMNAQVELAIYKDYKYTYYIPEEPNFTTHKYCHGKIDIIGQIETQEDEDGTESKS